MALTRAERELQAALDNRLSLVVSSAMKAYLQKVSLEKGVSVAAYIRELIERDREYFVTASGEPLIINGEVVKDFQESKGD